MQSEQTVAQELIDDLFALSMIVELLKSGRSDVDELYDRFQAVSQRCQQHVKTLLPLARCIERQSQRNVALRLN